MRKGKKGNGKHRVQDDDYLEWGEGGRMGDRII